MQLECAEIGSEAINAFNKGVVGGGISVSCSPQRKVNVKHGEGNVKRYLSKPNPQTPSSLENEAQVSTVGTHVVGKKTSISALHLAATFAARHLQLSLDALDNDFRPTGHGALYALDFLGQTPGRQGT